MVHKTHRGGFIRPLGRRKMLRPYTRGRGAEELLLSKNLGSTNGGLDDSLGGYGIQEKEKMENIQKNLKNLHLRSGLRKNIKFL